MEKLGLDIVCLHHAVLQSCTQGLVTFLKQTTVHITYRPAD